MKYLPQLDRKLLIFFSSILLYLLIFSLYIFIDIHPVDDSELSFLIKSELRLPRALVASLLAIGISAAGCITQTIFQNPLASPSILGASSGAVLITLLTNSFVSSLYQPIASFCGAFFVLGLFLVFWRMFSGSSLESLLIFGFATNTLISSINQLIISLDLLNFEKTTNSLLFLMGDLSSKSWIHVYIGALTILPALTISIIRSPKYDLLALGKGVAGNLGLNVDRTYLEALLMAGFMIGGAISIGGIFPFLGLVLPFIVRIFIGPSLIRLIPITCSFAACTTLAVDYLAQNIIYPDALYSGVIMALLGSPVFIALLLKQRSLT